MRIRHPKVAKGTPIGVNEGARKYNVPKSQVSTWISKGQIAVLQEASPGFQKLIDEADLYECVKDYEPHRDNAGRRSRLGRTLADTRPLVPATAPVNGNGHGAATVGGAPVLSSREWVDRFYAEQTRAMGGSIRKETKKSYDMTFKNPKRFLATFVTLPMERPIIMEYLHGLKNRGLGIQNGRSLSPGAKQLHFRVLCTFYNWLGREHNYQVPNLSHSNLPTPSAEKASYTSEEIRRLLAQVRAADEYTIVLMLAQTGCRRGELCSLTIENLHDHPKTQCPVCDEANSPFPWALASGKPTRANESGERVLYLADESYETLRKHLRLYRRMSWRAELLTETRLSSFMRQLQKRAGVYERGQNTHAFRRAYEAEFIRNGGSELFLDEILGHRKVDMRSLYFNAPVADVVEQARRYAPRRFLQKELFTTPALPGLEIPREEVPA